MYVYIIHIYSNIDKQYYILNLQIHTTHTVPRTYIYTHGH